MSNFPIDVTTARLVEFHQLADWLCAQELGRLPSHTDGDPVGEIIELMALQGHTGEQIQAWLHDQPEAVAHRAVPPLPPVPTRNEVCSVRLTFQGLSVQTAEFGALPWFDAALFSLIPEDRQAVYAAKRAAGDSHAIIQYDSNAGSIYDEPGQPYQQMTGPAFELYPEAFLAAIREVLVADFIPMIFMGGDDGERGYVIATAQLPGLIAVLRSGERDFTHDVLISPGWDGVFYGWSPAQIAAFGQQFRALCPNGHLAIEHQPGRMPVGNGPSDWARGAGIMEHYDVLLSEFANWPEKGDQIWQVAARSLGPAYRRPADQPAHDDPNPPWYLAPGTARGPYLSVAFEFAEYPWVRSRISAEDVSLGRAYFRALGYTCTG